MDTISVIIPTHGKAELLLRTLESLPRDDKKIEVIVVDATQEEPTRDILAGFAGVLYLVSPPGHSHQMNAGVEASSGDLLLFLDAGTCLETGWPQAVLQAARQPHFILGAFQARTGRRWLDAARHWRRALSRGPWQEPALFVKRRDFTGINGFPPPPPRAETALARALLASGKLYRLPLLANSA